VYDFVGLRVFRRIRQALGRFWYAAKVEQTGGKASGRVGTSGIDLPSHFGAIQSFAPAVFKSKNVRLATGHPSIPALQAVSTLQASVSAGEVTKKAPGHSVGSKPGGLHLGVFRTEIWIRFEEPQVVQQLRSFAAGVVGEITHAGI